MLFIVTETEIWICWFLYELMVVRVGQKPEHPINRNSDILAFFSFFFFFTLNLFWAILEVTFEHIA